MVAEAEAEAEARRQSEDRQAADEAARAEQKWKEALAEWKEDLLPQGGAVTSRLARSKRVTVAHEALATADLRDAYLQSLQRQLSRRYASPEEPWVRDAFQDLQAQRMRHEARRREEAEEAVRGRPLMVAGAVP